MFHHISKHLEFRQKYSAARRIFNSLLAVYGNVMKHSLSCLIYYVVQDKYGQYFSTYQAGHSSCRGSDGGNYFARDFLRFQSVSGLYTVHSCAKVLQYEKNAKNPNL